MSYFIRGSQEFIPEIEKKKTQSNNLLSGYGDKYQKKMGVVIVGDYSLLYEYELCRTVCFFNPCVCVTCVKTAKLKNKNN